MQIGRIKGATRVLGKSQGYLGLPVRDVRINSKVDGEDTPAMMTAWIPSVEELSEMAAGASIYVTILGVSHPPIMVGVGEKPEE